MIRLKPCIFLTLLCILLTSACANKQRGVRSTPSYEMNAQAKQAFDKIQNPKESLESLSGLIEVSVQARGQTRSFEAAILALAPNRLIIAILDDFGQTQAKLIANGKQVEWWEAQSGTKQYHSQDGRALKKFLQLPISINEFIERLLLKIPHEKISRTKSSNSNQTIEFRQQQHSFLLQTHPSQILAWQAYHSASQKKLRYQIRFSDFNENQVHAYPQSWEWSFQKPKSKITLDFVQLNLNPKISTEKFQTQNTSGDVY